MFVFVGASLGFAPLVSISTRTSSYSLHRSAVEYSLRRSAVFLKEASDEAEPPSLHGVGSICEFDEGKQGHARGLLGVIIKAESKAKGGARYEVLDVDGRTHPIKAAQVRATFAASKKLKDPLDAPLVLADYVSVAEKAPTELGVEPEMLEVAWELASEADAPLSAKQILGVIDEALCASPVQLFAAYRLLTSEVGRVFFKAIGDKYKAKAAKAVAASKSALCSAADADAYGDEFCLV
mmetsp:Transcript_2635/g.8776  ORF Transcript_2635/g.8776 Transcript_2635/m.8776 type:complete len:238 (-) Transcript_2635:132-845(-)